jgi:hypothetical protein
MTLKPRPSLTAELLALRETVQHDLATAPYELKQLAIAKLEPMLHDAYTCMYEGRGWYTTDDVMGFACCHQRRAAQLTNELEVMGLLARDTRVVNGRKRYVFKAV